MNPVLIVLDGYPLTFGQALGGALGAIALLLFVLVVALARSSAARRREAEAGAQRQRELEARIAAVLQSNAELSGRLGSMSEWIGARQTDLARVMAERLDNVGARLGAGLENHAQTTGANLNKLNERLAVIDAAQARMAGMTEEVVSLKDILANKQTRGAFGQGRMEAIVRDGLPAASYEFQAALSNKMRPDCVIRLPGDSRVLAVDAKFPLEAFTLFNEARSEEARKAAMSRVRTDVGKHVKDIMERYLLPGETQDIALMFVPSESIYSDLVEHFDDVVQKAHRGRVIIVSPSLLTMAIQVTQAILRDARMRDQAHAIHAEVGKLLNDVRLLAERTAKLEGHFRQAQEDVGVIATSAEK
ncbi:MAG TPA: DNA recombination protein RmuC, partial [Roseiarcus sp.]|nr:DNA recombination protein RmuC [Roseiarcus sp.]